MMIVSHVVGVGESGIPYALSCDTTVSDRADCWVPGFWNWLLMGSFYPQLSKDPNIIIAKMDATANDVPSPYEVRG